MGKLEKIEKFAAKGKADKLLPFLHDADQQVTLGAIQALGKFTSQIDVLGALAEVLDDGDVLQRKAAAEAFASAEGSYAESVLMHRMEQETDAGVKEVMRESLASIKKRSK
ncbi:HEAT repeat domain-containing protein [Acutalibacter muris]|uniref:HEAT repeat domain-containing protein n=1 Tax=Acutalibacter muris TaxID=1796620 RepID=UPI00272D8E9D|nr:HEAT repeat domain-containing protein [Acutalibacter muris]